MWMKWPLTLGSERPLNATRSHGIPACDTFSKINDFKNLSSPALFSIFQLELTYNIILFSGVQHSDSIFLCLTQSDHHDKSSNRLSPQLLHYYCLYSLCCTLHPCDLCHNRKFVLLNPLPLFCLSPTLSAMATVIVFSMSLFSFCLFVFVLQIPHVREIIWYLSPAMLLMG